MKSFNDTLTELLKKDSRFIDENNELIRAEIINEALKIDKDLISILLSNKEIKDKFFTEIKGHWIFEMNKFIDYIQDKNFLNDSYTKYKNKIGLSIGGKLLEVKGEVALSFPFKDCILEGGQTKEEEKRREIFFNEILAQDEIDRLLEPKVLTNFKRYTSKGEEKVNEIKRDEKEIIRENLIIKGNNLLALHSIKKQFQGKVKLIYIDPPYNTGNDSFGYNDNFNHSTWLTFMKNRLDIAKNLLHENGVIFVQVDEKECAYLKVLMDEIFDRSNFITTITCKVKGPSGVASGSQFIFDTNEYIHVYKNTSAKLKIGYKVDKEVIDKNSKTIKNYYYVLDRISLKNKKKIKELKANDGLITIYKIPNEDYLVKTIPKKEREQKIYIEKFDKIYRLQTLSGGTEKRVLENIKDNEMYVYEYSPMKGKYKGQMVQNLILQKGAISFLKDVAYIKKIENKKVPVRLEYVTNSWMNGWWQGIAKEGAVMLKNGKKPEKLIQQIIEMSTDKGDIVLDYHLGSGTTASVAHKMERQYIGIEQLNYEENGSVPRLKNVIKGDPSGISTDVNWKGGGDFIYCELARYNDDFIEKIYKAQNTKELLKIWKEMKEKSFINYNVDIKTAEEHLEDFKQLLTNKQKEILIQMLNKNQLYVNLSEIEDSHFKVNKEDRELNKKFYG